MISRKISKQLLFVTVLMLLTAIEVQSQTDSLQFSENSIYFEAGGIGGLYSLNYEKSIIKKGKMSVGIRVGVSVFNFFDFVDKFNPEFTVPISINGCYGNNHNIDFGFGQTISSINRTDRVDYTPKRNFDLHANMTIGYRYQKRRGGLILGIRYTSLIEYYNFFTHWGGVIVGYAF